MTEFFIHHLDACFALLLGIFACFFSCTREPSESRFTRRQARSLRFMRIGGPLLILYGLARMLFGFARARSFFVPDPPHEAGPPVSRIASAKRGPEAARPSGSEFSTFIATVRRGALTLDASRHYCRRLPSFEGFASPRAYSARDDPR